jgi:hypothetical protein
VSDLPVFSRSSSKELCKLKVIWNSFYACRICGSFESEDYTIQTTECEENTQRVSYVRTSNCFGPAILNVHDESCVPKYAFPMYVLIAVAVLFLVLALIALLVYLRYRSLTTKVSREKGNYHWLSFLLPPLACLPNYHLSKYSLLAEEKSKNLEMSDIQSNSSSQSAEDISGR